MSFFSIIYLQFRRFDFSITATRFRSLFSDVIPRGNIFFNYLLLGFCSNHRCGIANDVQQLEDVHIVQVEGGLESAINKLIKYKKKKFFKTTLAGWTGFSGNPGGLRITSSLNPGGLRSKLASKR